MMCYCYSQTLESTIYWRSDRKQVKTFFLCIMELTTPLFVCKVFHNKLRNGRLYCNEPSLWCCEKQANKTFTGLRAIRATTLPQYCMCQTRTILHLLQDLLYSASALKCRMKAKSLCGQILVSPHIYQVFHISITLQIHIEPQLTRQFSIRLHSQRLKLTHASFDCTHDSASASRKYVIFVQVGVLFNSCLLTFSNMIPWPCWLGS